MKQIGAHLFPSSARSFWWWSFIWKDLCSHKDSSVLRMYKEREKGGNNLVVGVLWQPHHPESEKGLLRFLTHIYTYNTRWLSGLTTQGAAAFPKKKKKNLLAFKKVGWSHHTIYRI